MSRRPIKANERPAPADSRTGRERDSSPSPSSADRPTSFPSGQQAIAYLGLGANLGDREASLRAALAALDRDEEVRVLRHTSFEPSEPWGEADQPEFLNCVAEVETSLPPRALLRLVKEIERSLGRTPTRRWGPRVIDIDILTWGDVRMSTAELTLPHPHLLARPFVWEPLAQLAPELVGELRRDAAVSL